MNNKNMNINKTLIKFSMLFFSDQNILNIFFK